MILSDLSPKSVLKEHTCESTRDKLAESRIRNPPSDQIVCIWVGHALPRSNCLEIWVSESRCKIDLRNCEPRVSPMSPCYDSFLIRFRRHQKTHIMTTDPLHQDCLATHVIESYMSVASYSTALASALKIKERSDHYLLAPESNIALRVCTTSSVDINNGVTSSTPVCRVRTLIDYQSEMPRS
jgi:hypothetical protein